MRNPSWLTVTLISLTTVACSQDPALDTQDSASLSEGLMTACFASWSSTQVYTSGMSCSKNGQNYTAAFWTQGDDPASHSGPQGSGNPWITQGACSGSSSGTTGGTSVGTTGGTTGGTAAAGTINPHLNTGLCLDVSGANTANGTAVQVYTCNGSAAQQWQFSGGRLTAFNGTKCLDVPNGSTARGTYVQIWDCSDNNANQQWVQNGATYVWKQGGMCLDIPSSNAVAGQHLWTYTCNGTDAQNWVSNVSSGATGGTTTGGTTTGGTTTGGTTGGSSEIVFSPYKDVTINTNWNTSVISSQVTGSLQPVVSAVPNVKTVTWAFATGECGSETWGGLAAGTLASANVSAWVAAGKNYILSTGGAAGSFTCGSDAGFQAFIDRYYSANLLGIDFDIEAGQSQDVINNLVARVKAAQSNAKYSRLRFSFTVATLGGNVGQSLGSMGQMVMSAIKSGGLSNYYVNLMAMDYGAANASNCTLGSGGLCNMGASAVSAANNLHSFYGVPYKQIELTPMIGGNDTQNETFSLSDVTTVTSFAKQNGLGGVHFWSLDRDTDCAPGFASPTCNSYGQAGTLGFSNAFGSNL